MKVVMTRSLATQFWLAAAMVALCCAGLAPRAEASPLTPIRVAATGGEEAYAPDTVLVRFRPGAAAVAKEQARAAVNGAKIRAFGLVKGLEQMRVGPGVGVAQAVERLRRLPVVDYVEPDYVRYADTNDTYYDLLWGLHNTGQSIRNVTGAADADIDAEEAWSIFTGDPGLIVAVIDSGVEYSHADLDDNVWTNPGEVPGDNIDNDGNGYIDDIHGWDFFANDNDPLDEEGHGTHVAGTICAEGNNGQGVTGVAWQCRIMVLRFLGPDGGLTSDAIAALDYAVAQGVKISNNSWGGGGFSQGLYDAIQNAGQAGHLFVAAAGNGGIDGIGDDTDFAPHYPSSYDLANIVSVAATDNRDRLAGFSNYGLQSVDVGAPGVDIASTMLSSYYWSSGTSMAAPHVSGLAALLLGRHPDWTYVDVKERLLNTVRPVADLAGKSVTGGLINALAALQEATVAPSAPFNLTATAASEARIDLAWTDDADNEDGFHVERSQNGVDWTLLTSVGANATGYADTGLAAETTYHYRVQAYNSAGESVYSNTATATTEPMPTSQQVVANSETTGAGSVAGTYQDTWTDNGVAEAITERSSGGRPALRHSYLEHTWSFQVPGGNTSLQLNAWADVSADGDSFRFSYSQDGSTFTEMLVISGGDDSSWYSYNFPPETSATVYVRVTDTDQTAGNNILDTVYVDQLYILSDQEVGTTPAAPSELTAQALVPGQVELAWTDHATDEYGFKVERSADDGASWAVIETLGIDATTYTDTTVASLTTYSYRVRAYNGAGNSAYSNQAVVTALEDTSLDLQATAYKVKGWQNVDLAWSDAEMPVDLYRDGQTIAASLSGGVYTDANIDKGGGSYTYTVCEAGGTTNCANEVNVNF